jgi:glutamate-1-semialdehyde 2,1-aminomutase
MSMVSPLGPVYQAGTLYGNPLAMTAGIETIKILSKGKTYKKLEYISGLLEKGLIDAAEMAGVKTKFYRAGTMFCTYFTETYVIDYKTAKTSDTSKFSKFFSGMLKKGINLAPSQFEAGFISLAHTEKDVEKTVRAAYEAFKEC